jgi:hypothetical protein
MARIFYPSSERLSFLLETIHDGELALPDFQRNFVWEPHATEELVESLCQNFPAGSLLRIRNSGAFFFVPREFDGAPPLDGRNPSHLILDGQQRLTALYQALYGVGNYRYFVDLGGLLDGEELEDCVFHLRREEAERHYGAIEQQAEALVLPLSVLSAGRGGFDDWLDEAVELADESLGEPGDLRKGLRKVRQDWLVPLEEYEFPMVTLSEGTSALAVCTIFETLNRTGVKLSAFDLMVARMWPQDLRLRDLWADALRRHPIIADFDVDPFQVLQAIALARPDRGRPPSCRRRDVLGLAVEQVRSGWRPVVQGLAAGLELLRDRCGVLLPRLLPYNMMLVPLAATLAAAPAKGAAQDATLSKLRRWFWCSVFGQTYESSPNVQAATDFSELTGWIAGGRLPRSVAGFTFQPQQIRTITVRQRSLYRGAMALLLSQGARDFRTGTVLTPSLMAKGRFDDHHVFPPAFLARHKLDDSFLNRTMMDDSTHRRTRGSAPSRYLDEIEAEVGAKTLGAVVASHLLPRSRKSGLRRDDFSSFLDERAKLVAEAISRATR